MSAFDRAAKNDYTLAEIENAIKNRHMLYSYAEQGDIESIHVLIDSERALEKANPTDIQLKTMDLVWVRGYSLVETAKMFDVTPQAVRFNLNLSSVKLKKVLDEWLQMSKEEEKHYVH
ncbi:hypothetical protein ACIU4M_00560 [Bacillus altitudinis]|uniref:hypothetical protein n=1 Tax=Bacillus altitudinis TaxID=293387 RepID=UPI003899EB8F